MVVLCMLWCYIYFLLHVLFDWASGYLCSIIVGCKEILFCWAFGYGITGLSSASEKMELNAKISFNEFIGLLRLTM